MEEEKGTIEEVELEPKVRRGSRPKGSSSTSSKKTTKPSYRIKKPSRRREVEDGDENFIHTMFVSPVANLAVEGLANAEVARKSTLPNSTEIDGIFRPIERIILRRLPVDATNQALAGMSPDGKDFLLASGALLAYGVRIIAESPKSGTVTKASGRINNQPKPERATSRRTESTSKADSNPSSNGAVGEQGIVYVESVDNVNPQTYAEALMSDLHRKTYREPGGESIGDDFDDVLSTE